MAELLEQVHGALQGRGGQALDGPGGEAALELAAAQQHIEPVARQGDAHAAVVVGIRGRFDERLGFQALDEGGRGGPGDAELAGDLTGAGTVGPALIDRLERGVGAVRQPVRATGLVPGALQRQERGAQALGLLQRQLGAITHGK